MPPLKNTKHEGFAVFCDRVRAGAQTVDAADHSGVALWTTDFAHGFYVYGLSDPRDGRLFYVGKGSRKRYAFHVKDAKRCRGRGGHKAKTIWAILQSGLTPDVCILGRDMVESAAFELERFLIQNIGFAALTNKMPVYNPIRATLIRALNNLHRMVPFDEWSSYGPSAEAVEMYWFVHDGFVKVCRMCLEDMGYGEKA